MNISIILKKKEDTHSVVLLQASGRGDRPQAVVKGNGPASRVY